MNRWTEREAARILQKNLNRKFTKSSLAKYPRIGDSTRSGLQYGILLCGGESLAELKPLAVIQRVLLKTIRVCNLSDSQQMTFFTNKFSLPSTTNANSFQVSITHAQPEIRNEEIINVPKLAIIIGVTNEVQVVGSTNPFFGPYCFQQFVLFLLMPKILNDDFIVRYWLRVMVSQSILTFGLFLASDRRRPEKFSSTTDLQMV